MRQSCHYNARTQHWGSPPPGGCCPGVPWPVYISAFLPISNPQPGLHALIYWSLCAYTLGEKQFSSPEPFSFKNNLYQVRFIIPQVQAVEEDLDQVEITAIWRWHCSTTLVFCQIYETRRMERWLSSKIAFQGRESSATWSSLIRIKHQWSESMMFTPGGLKMYKLRQHCAWKQNLICFKAEKGQGPPQGLSLLEHLGEIPWGPAPRRGREG